MCTLLLANMQRLVSFFPQTDRGRPAALDPVERTAAPLGQRVPLLSALYGVNNAASKSRLLVTRGATAMRREAHTLHPQPV